MIWTAATLKSATSSREHRFCVSKRAIFNRGGLNPVLFWTALVIDRRYSRVITASPGLLAIRDESRKALK